jgi:hypothetical protein
MEQVAEFLCRDVEELHAKATAANAGGAQFAKSGAASFDPQWPVLKLRVARFETKRPICGLNVSKDEAMVVALPDDGPACKKCGRKMGVVADIAPLGNEPGLRAFLCDRCGATDSVLVYQTNRSTAPKDVQQQQQPQPKQDEE